MDGLAPAARPGDELVLQHRAKTFTAARLMDNALAWLEQRQLQAVRPPMVLAREVVAAAGESPATIEPNNVAPALADVVPPVAEAVVAAPEAPQAQAEPSGRVAKRWQELEAKVARGEELTGARQEWRRRQLAQRARSRPARSRRDGAEGGQRFLHIVEETPHAP